MIIFMLKLNSIPGSTAIHRLYLTAGVSPEYAADVVAFFPAEYSGFAGNTFRIKVEYKVMVQVT